MNANFNFVPHSGPFARGIHVTVQAVAQQHTRWSVTYDMRSGAVHVVTAKRWQTVHEFVLPMKS